MDLQFMLQFMQILFASILGSQVTRLLAASIKSFMGFVHLLSEPVSTDFCGLVGPFSFTTLKMLALRVCQYARTNKFLRTYMHRNEL